MWVAFVHSARVKRLVMKDWIDCQRMLMKKRWPVGIRDLLPIEFAISPQTFSIVWSAFILRFYQLSFCTFLSHLFVCGMLKFVTSGVVIENLKSYENPMPAACQVAVQKKKRLEIYHYTCKLVTLIYLSPFLQLEYKTLCQQKEVCVCFMHIRHLATYTLSLVCRGSGSA